MYAHYIILIMHVPCNYTLAVDQVTGVTLTCQPVGLINRCTVMWNVSLYTCVSITIYTDKLLEPEILSNYTYVHSNYTYVS